VLALEQKLWENAIKKTTSIKKEHAPVVKETTLTVLEDSKNVKTPNEPISCEKASTYVLIKTKNQLNEKNQHDYWNWWLLGW
jgi:hypothetical protein